MNDFSKKDNFYQDLIINVGYSNCNTKKQLINQVVDKLHNTQLQMIDQAVEKSDLTQANDIINYIRGL